MSYEPTNDRVIKTYVWHEGKCFFVSTIERNSSAVGGPRRYNETLVWDCDWALQAKGERSRGALRHQGDDNPGSIVTHQRIVEAIHDVGEKAFEDAP